MSAPCINPPPTEGESLALIFYIIFLLSIYTGIYHDAWAWLCRWLAKK